MMQLNQLWVFMFMLALYIFDIEAKPVFTKRGYHETSQQQESSESDDEEAKLMAEIWASCALCYKSLIDVSGLYFSGLIIDMNQLGERMLFECGKHFFQIIRLLAMYGPRMLQNPKISWKVKAKKTAGIVSFMVVFWLWAQEMNKRQQKQYLDRMSFDNQRMYSNPMTSFSDPYRPRMSNWS